MKKNNLAVVVFATIVMFSPMVLADGTEIDTPPEEQDAKAKEIAASKAGDEFVAYLEDVDRRYPDSGKVDVDRFMAEEGEKVASLYCATLGFNGPCAPVATGGKTTFAPIALKAAGPDVGRSDWWNWLWNHLFNVGVIPEQNACPSPYAWTQFYMDDEDRRNANSRWGWLGATSSTNNTAWRFCKLDTTTSLLFRPLPSGGNEYDYAVQNMGIFCPSGARRVFRREDNEDWANANSSSGDVFPSFNLWPGNWHMFTCHFDGAASSFLGHMAAFPNLGFKYGVYAPTNMPSRYALQHGYVYQDDEDFFNLNFWIGSPDTVMGGGSNTWRALAKVQ
ncbi:MAG: hypothetical protein WAZ48_14470 [Lysobacteraceae bacterium]